MEEAGTLVLFVGVSIQLPWRIFWQSLVNLKMCKPFNTFFQHISTIDPWATSVLNCAGSLIHGFFSRSILEIFFGDLRQFIKTQRQNT